jgi:glycosyltransferase involved in cell wall biosynthesis
MPASVAPRQSSHESLIGLHIDASATQPIDHVVVLNDFCFVQGGASKVAIDEAIALREHGIAVTFLAPVGPPCEALRDAGVRIVCLDQPELADVARHPSAALLGLSNRPACRALRGLLAVLDPARSIVHLHGYTKALSAFPALAAHEAGFRVVCTLHDFFTACPNGAFYDYRREAPCELTALSFSCMTTHCDKRHVLHKGYRVMRGMVQRHVAQFPSCVRDYITLSRRSAALLAPYLPDDAMFYPLENIIDIARRPPVDPAANRELLVLGRLDAEKGVLFAAEAARGAGWPIVFAGDGTERQALQTAGANVTGWLSAEQVQHRIDHARCLIFPSRWYETYGLVVAEAAARGVPAIVSDISAAAERVEHGITGWIFRSGDADDLRRCMAVLHDDAAVRAAGAAAYQRFWSDPPDRARHAAELLSIYAAVLIRDGSRSLSRSAMTTL